MYWVKGANRLRSRVGKKESSRFRTNVIRKDLNFQVFLNRALSN